MAFSERRRTPAVLSRPGDSIERDFYLRAQSE